VERLEEGIDREKLDFVMDLKNNRRGRIKEYVERYTNATFLEGERPWGVKADVALPLVRSYLKDSFGEVFGLEYF